MYLPLFLKTDLLPCLIVGGGKVAAHKAGILLRAGCRLTVIAPEIDESLKEAAAGSQLRWLARGYREGDCAGFHLVIAASDCEAANAAASSEARRLGIPVNVVDAPELCTVIFGASWREGPLTVSVSTGGAAPFMAAAVRDRLAEAASGMGDWVEAAGRFRNAVRRTILNPDEKDRLYARFVACTLEHNSSDFPRTEEWHDWLAYLGRAEVRR